MLKIVKVGGKYNKPDGTYAINIIYKEIIKKKNTINSFSQFIVKITNTSPIQQFYL